MPPEYLDGYGRLNAETDVSIAGGECWAFVEEFDRALAAGAADYLQPDVTSVGGFTSLRRVAANGHAAGIQVLPHVFGSVVALAASLQGLSTIPSDPLLEFDRTPIPSGRISRSTRLRTMETRCRFPMDRVSASRLIRIFSKNFASISKIGA